MSTEPPKAAPTDATGPAFALRVLMLVQDGVSLRNFCYSKLPEMCRQHNIELLVWAPASIASEINDIKSVTMPVATLHPATTLLKQIKIAVLLRQFSNRYKRPAYRHYYFPAFRQPGKSLRRLALSVAYRMGKWWYPGRLSKLQAQLEAYESGTPYFKQCLGQLEHIKPGLLFCTNQRQTIAIAPVEAAKRLNIPVLTHIFSWDNLPKATMVVSSNFYSVWSQYMKEELLKFYPSIQPQQILVTGAPQFEMYTMQKYQETRSSFCLRNHLDESLRYVCFSGDDETTSPFDPFYLRDLAEAVRKVNTVESERWGILFRPVPVDKSNRYARIIAAYPDVIFEVKPMWQGAAADWATVLPAKEDCTQLVSTVRYSEAVFNIGSSMVFDFINFSKPCYFLHYRVRENAAGSWDTKKIYDFIHFDSMPSTNAVKWIRSADDFAHVLLHDLPAESFDPQPTVAWYNTIVQAPAQEASERMVRAMQLVNANSAHVTPV